MPDKPYFNYFSVSASEFAASVSVSSPKPSFAEPSKAAMGAEESTAVAMFSTVPAVLPGNSSLLSTVSASVVSKAALPGFSRDALPSGFS